MLSEKQAVYIEILRGILPYARSVQTWPWYHRLRLGNLYTELELVHNIPPLLEHEEFTDQDAYWLNIQANNYLRQCAGKERPESRTAEKCIRKLAEMVPDNKKALVTVEPVKSMLAVAGKAC